MPEMRCLAQVVTDSGTAGILQRGTPDMDGVPGVTQVSVSCLTN